MVITHDPLEYIDSYNPFTFAALDPINFWDPWGLSASNQDLAGGAGGFAGLRPQSQVQFSHWLPAPPSNDPNTMLVYNGENPCAVIPDAIHCKSGPPPSPDELEDRRHPDAGDVATGAGKAAMGEALYLHCVSATFGGGAVPCAFVAGALQDHLAPFENEDEALGAAILFLAQFAAGLTKGLVKGAIDDFVTLLRRMKPCSFTAGTPVLMCDGTYKSIEEVEEGDWVLSQDPKTGELGCKEVEDPYSNQDRAIILVELRRPDGSVEVIETTDNHPFFVTNHGWTRVDSLRIGDEVPASDGRFLQVVGLTWTDRIETVYNFGVDGFHTYFVGESGAWVHNCLEENVEALRKWAKDRGYERVSELSEESIERWNDPKTGQYRLKIKTKSAEYGDSKGPRFEAKTGDGEWVNPLNGKEGGKELSHEPLDEDYGL